MLRVNHLTVARLMAVTPIVKIGGGVKKLLFPKWSHHLVWHNMGTIMYDKMIITSSVLGEKARKMVELRGIEPLTSTLPA